MAENPDRNAPKPALQLKSQKFREARQGDWRLLNAQLEKAERDGLKSFSIDELLNLPVLYRSAMSSLSMAQSISLDRNLITYLQTLCARAYVNIYGPQTRLKEVLAGFFVRAWPRSFRSLGLELILAFVLFFGGAVLGWLLCAQDPTWYGFFMPGEYRSVDSSVAELKETLGGNTEDQALSPFAVFLMGHNTQVAIMAFAFGIMFGLPSVALLILNGIPLGAMLWLFHSKGLGLEFAAWLSIHGTTELFAIIIAGACGLHIGRRLIFPGDQPRRDSLMDAGRLTGTVMIGVAAMLTVAGCLEGFGRQLITESWIRFAIGGAMLTLWLSYFFFVGRERKHG
ncbi:hypothetical protein ABAC460_13855 [Asticcacaulis sp. AC460]|uniref:stage II sporulation protein M n=1 Tax=Asticcacaulis sp. AC460 TaxID=1282360 RepID=UPI0003C407F9|nr:stage II sporulation protein M [Asticcacaulis sp. AC460]ESQ88860.1 hypothetical protein ABAC460_13855 [Asticcacaulis sp. AC460]